VAAVNSRQCCGAGLYNLLLQLLVLLLSHGRCTVGRTEHMATTLWLIRPGPDPRDQLLAGAAHRAQGRAMCTR
jgi:hypothetical protein